jgi:CHASE3 domain sensor protein
MHDLLQLARERGYLLANELNQARPTSEGATEEIDELFSALETASKSMKTLQRR